MQQVITIGTVGQVSGLQRKPGQGVDLTKLGTAAVTRASEIVWDETHQKWKVDVLQEAGKGVLTGAKLVDAFPEDRPLSDLLYRTSACVHNDANQPVLFGSYDMAVTMEIAYLDALRLRGEH